MGVVGEMLLKIKSLYNHGTEFIAAVLLGVMFVTFLLQIFSRYILGSPFGWTLELCLTLWLWTVFFGIAFVVRETDHVKFDIFYHLAPRGLRVIFGLISATAIVLAMLWALPATWDYVDFMRIRKSAVLKIPMNQVFIIYVVFMGAMIVRYGFTLVKILRSKQRDQSSEFSAEKA